MFTKTQCTKLYYITNKIHINIYVYILTFYISQIFMSVNLKIFTQ